MAEELHDLRTKVPRSTLSVIQAIEMATGDLSEALPADHWITHLPQKSWVTDAHMAEFRSLLAVHHG